jgi:multiple sugar transport system permease protein
MTRYESSAGRMILLLVLVAGAVTMTIPFLWSVATSLKDPAAVYIDAQSFIPRDPKTREVSIQWHNYVDVWRKIPLARMYYVSLVVAIVATLGRVFTSSLAAYAFARLEFPGRDKLFLLYLATLMIPGEVTIIPTFIIISLLPQLFTGLGHSLGQPFGMNSHFAAAIQQNFAAFGQHLGMNTYFALIAPQMFTAFGTFMLRQFFLTIPKDLEDAALIDGCSRLGIWGRIILPLSVPALVTLVIFTFLGSWNNFMWPLIVANDASMWTIPVGLANLKGDYSQEIALLLSASVQVLIPVFILFVFCQRRITEGIVMSGFGGI